jgi:hypothetical protein
MIESEPLRPQIKYRDTILDFEEFPQIASSGGSLPLPRPTVWRGEEAAL